MESAGVYQIPTFEILERHALPSEATWVDSKENNVRVHAQFSMTMALCYLVKHPKLLGA
ncbi:hypothetical protein SAMN04488078_100348 [Antarctobacter heliothermus]|uniref:Uncharacterized protein n=2 Tax=Antarctobacter heliothermus TaxID=74033 RepID=A0A239BE28_9RHOB|nr:hypothetical protein SAMN04488078_100348 [Antarctobacter heliothermus]